MTIYIYLAITTIKNDKIDNKNWLKSNLIYK